MKIRTWRCKWSAFLVCLLIGGAPGKAFAQSPEAYFLKQDLREGFDSIHPVYLWNFSALHHRMRYLEDPEGKLSLDSVKSLLRAGQFRSVESAGLQEPLGRVTWAYLKLRGDPSSDGNYLFQAGRERNSFQRIDVYAIDDRQEVTHKKTGFALSPGEKDVRNAFNFFRLDIARSRSVELFLRLEDPNDADPSCLNILHIDPKSVRELEACRLSGDYLAEKSREIVERHTLFSLTMENLPDAGYSFEELLADSIWDRHARFNDWENYGRRDAFWLRARMIAEEGGNFFFYLQRWTHADLYLLDESGRYYLEQSGIRRSYREKGVDNPRNFFRLNVPAGDTVNVYARVYSTVPSVTIPPNKEFFIAQVDESSYKDTMIRNSWFLMFQGFLLAVVILSLMIYLWLPDRIVLYFLILAVGNLVYDASVYPQDTIFQIFPLLKVWERAFSHISHIIIMIGAVKFVSEYVGLSKFFPRSAKYINVFLLVVLIWRTLGVFYDMKSYELGEFFNWPQATMDSIVRFHEGVGMFLSSVSGFFLIILIPAIGIFKKVKYAWLLALSTVAPASGTMAYGIFFILFTIGNAGLYDLSLPDDLTPIYPFIQVGEFIFITVYAVLIGAKAYRMNQERQVAFLARAEAESLRQLDQAKTRFYTNISHEFRTPITVIMGMAKQVRETPEKWFREGLDMIVQNSRRLLNLVNQMLDLSKLEAGALPVNNRQGDIIAFFRNMLEPFTWHAQLKNIQLHFVPKQKELIMDFDPEKLMNIFSNLLSNAIKYTQAGGHIYFQTENLQENGRPFLVIKVKDTGAGILPEHLPFIFDRFFSSPAAQVGEENFSHPKEGLEGTGIGLALTKELVKLLKGEIFVESKVGVGSEFIVNLPVRREASPQYQAGQEDLKQMAAGFFTLHSRQSEDYSTIAQQGDLPIVLIVEDNPDVITYIEACLSGKYRVKAAGNGAQGLEMALELVPDVIISDVMMPVMDGFEMLDRVKNDMRTSHIPVIMLTARADAASRLEGLERGADAYLAKPFNEEELQVHIRKLIELRRKLQDRYALPAKEEPSDDKTLQIEDRFMQEVRRVLEANLDDEFFGIPELCLALAMSRAQLYRKFQALTNQSVNKYILSFRLNKARELLETTSLNVTQAALETGFKNQSHFSRAFIEEFGVSPSSVRNKSAH